VCDTFVTLLHYYMDSDTPVRPASACHPSYETLSHSYKMRSVRQVRPTNFCNPSSDTRDLYKTREVRLVRPASARNPSSVTKQQEDQGTLVMI
jgi:hypothetical protein